MNNFELAVNLFENHLNTISIILSIVGVIFVILGLISYSQIMKHIKQSIDSIVQQKVAKEIDESNIKNKIEQALNEKIENYNISIEDIVKRPEQEKKL